VGWYGDEDVVVVDVVVVDVVVVDMVVFSVVDVVVGSGSFETVPMTQ
jgi:hypothetical protein